MTVERFRREGENMLNRRTAFHSTWTRKQYSSEWCHPHSQEHTMFDKICHKQLMVFFFFLWIPNFSCFIPLHDAVCQSRTGRLTGYWFLLNRPKGWILMNEWIPLHRVNCECAALRVFSAAPFTSCGLRSEALCHKPEGHGFDLRWGSLIFFHLLN
jgi:hypothetical protein